MNNPIKEVRESTGLNRAKFALKIGVAYDQLMRVENGYLGSVPTSVAEGLQDVYGCNPSRLQNDYHAWKNSQVG